MPWSIEEENQLRRWLSEGVGVKTIAARLGKTADAVTKKALRLGLEVVGYSLKTTTSLKLPEQLPTVEEMLRILTLALRFVKGPDVLCVVRVESREGKFDKVWVSGITRRLMAKKTCALDYEALKEDDRRDLLLNLRGVFEKRQLLVSGRYTPLIVDLAGV
ncbi:hypothetical protein G4O51_09585 [Candidatus Bathyarchaeota archaeon A05DMB-2]|jgi:hypothetical protein|nr:hypothetical protein [Candidatus Bathyarchaeota archaeon A05DMB-2]